MRDASFDKVIASLRELERMQEEISQEIEAAKDQIKAAMTAAGDFELLGSDYKVTWKEVTTNKLDSTALKKALPDVAAQFTKSSTSRRFLLN